MRGSGWQCAKRAGTSAAIALVLWGAFAPSSARASCGDYVTIVPPGPTPAEPAPPWAPEPTPCPCRRALPFHEAPPCPGCSAPVVPDAPALPGPVVQPEELAIPTGCPVLVPASYAQFTCPIYSEAPARPPLGIFRPPRLPALNPNL